MTYQRLFTASRRSDAWYRAPSPHAGSWVLVQPRAVPAALVSIPPGKYKGWKPSKHEKEAAKAERKAAKKGGKHGHD